MDYYYIVVCYDCFRPFYEPLISVASERVGTKGTERIMRTTRKKKKAPRNWWQKYCCPSRMRGSKRYVVQLIRSVVSVKDYDDKIKPNTYRKVDSTHVRMFRNHRCTGTLSSPAYKSGAEG